MQGFISSVGSLESGGQGGAGDSFVKLNVNLTNISPTIETINNKEYKKFTFAKTNLTFKTVTPLGDEDTIAVNDALIYNLLPISNNNEDKGVYISYDGNTFSGYVLAQESTLTSVTFMFAYYIILSQTSVVWQNYVDLVFNSGGEGGEQSGYMIVNTRGNITIPDGVTSVYVTLVGGGGGGGGGVDGSRSTGTYHEPTYGRAGGGGGSGYQSVDNVLAVTPGETLYCAVGAGGSGGASASTGSTAGNGNSGGSTYITRGSTTLFSVNGGSGGSGGSGYSSGGAGGSGFQNGGSSTNGSSTYSNGAAGGSGLRNVNTSSFQIYGGKGGKGGQSGSYYISPGSGASGSSGFIYIGWGACTFASLGG